ncbi:hypothetical protein, partial [Novispirillum itersonii]|uniref:hypothetical protein n=1 Tax=Novispirillum itersonii TaxID=189 RepID=UPI0004756FF6
ILSINENIPNTSTCIGQKTSPLCAVETKIGCEALNNEDLCKTAGYDEEYIKLIARTSPDVYFDAYISYRFPVVKEVRKGDRISVKGIRAQPGNYVVEFEETRCRTILKSCFRVYGSRTTYLVKKSRNTWEVVAQHNPDDDDRR